MDMGYSSCRPGGVAGMESLNSIMELKKLTVYMTSGTGVWPCSRGTQVFGDMVLMDSGRPSAREAGFVAPRQMLVMDSVIVANSPVAEFVGGNRARVAIGVYDQGSEYRRVHFVGFTKENDSSLLVHAGGIVKNSENRGVGVSFSPERYAAYRSTSNGRPLWVLSGMHDDEEGTLTGVPNSYLTTDSPLLNTPHCSDSAPYLQDTSTFKVCNFRIVRARVKNATTTSNGETYFFRADRNGGT